MLNDTLKHLTELVNCQSITPLSDGSIEYIEKLLTQHGFSVITKIFGEPDYQVTNLYAVYGVSKPNICFAGHVDVVPTGNLDSWSHNPFKATKVEDKIYGRGVVDMKGALACSLAATIEFIKLKPKLNGSVSFLLTSDEEGPAKYGTSKMLPYLTSINHKIDLAILGEPTCEREIGDIIKIGRRGSINFTLTVYGIQGHVAYPELAENPIHCLVKIMHNLSSLQLDYGSKQFLASNLEVTSIDVGNNTTNIIPGTASAKFNIRFNDLHGAESIVTLIKRIVEQHTLKYELVPSISANVFIQEPNHLISEFAKIIPQITGIIPKFSTSGGTSDARFIKNYCQVVEFGLLSETAHKIDEYTTISDLQRLYSVYYRALEKFVG
ncbi:succinyl-diaminopimelate desuccinylase [Candidatus Trichorickettsia mobilis]|uniref:succinyl-diaminopimelate desuccinylase n=1 Tax=Candidatus Trichorickettsia mobilis TaxID=1346319 RepID=UPI00292F59B5|nr:succinyl-diaminopimelate desuccinylase [Candidatus Trichorickettsia mobilis]